MGVWLPPHRYVHVYVSYTHTHIANGSTSSFSHIHLADFIRIRFGVVLTIYLSSHLAAAVVWWRPNTIHTYGDLDVRRRFGSQCLHTK